MTGLLHARHSTELAIQTALATSRSLQLRKCMLRKIVTFAIESTVHSIASATQSAPLVPCTGLCR
jgi:hypothetical protein